MFVYETFADVLGRYGYMDINLRPSPYVVSQMNGAYYWLPDFIGSKHPLEDRADVEAWYARLNALGAALDQETDRIRHDAAMGVIPPGFIIEETVAQIAKLRDGPPMRSALMGPAIARAAKAGLGDIGLKGDVIFRSVVAPALARQIDALTQLRSRAVDAAGVWRLPDGEAYYGAALRANTTLTTGAAELHQAGLVQVAALIDEIDRSLKALGLSTGSVGKRIDALNRDPRFLVSNDDTGRAKLMALAQQALANVSSRLPRAFNHPVVDAIVVKRVPIEVEAGAPSAFYSEGAPGQPGSFMLNLARPSDYPVWRLPTLAHHEGVPGHHFQFDVMRRGGALPLFSRMLQFSAYVEGWALYAQQVADEIGVYESDPFGRIGYLQSELFRAARIVVDTGIHHRRWTREQAVEWMVSQIGETSEATRREIDRYCVYPGQACSFKAGANAIVAAREDARRRLGARFDVRTFHDLVLNSGTRADGRPSGDHHPMERLTMTLAPVSVSRRLLLMAGPASVASVCGGARAAAPSSSASAALNQLIADSGQADRALDPLLAMRHGPGEADAGFVDPLSDAYAQRRLRNKQADKAQLSAIDRSQLDMTGQIAYDVFRYTTDQALEQFSSGVFVINRLTPLDPSFGLQVEFPDAASGAGTRFESAQDYQRGVERLHGFSAYLLRTVARLEEGRAKGYLQPRIIVTNVLAEVDIMLALKTEDTPFYQPVTAFPASISSADQARFVTAYRQVIETEVLSGYRLWKTYLTESYLPVAREAPGLWAQKDGEAVYAAALRRHTTTRLSAEEIHSLGLSEVARIRGELETVHQTIGYPGNLHALFEHIRTDPKFYYTKPQDLLDRFKAIEARIWPAIPRLFNRKPRAPFEVRPLPSMGAARGTGYYTLGPPDGVSPGVLYFNMSMLSTRPIPTLETLTLHEGIPGHHFQGTLAEENASLPDILRFGLHANNGFTAYIEGWGLYAESLGKALGMFTDPYQWFGHLDFEMLRAVRLVVDTGMHAKGWSRDRAITFMTDNTSMAAKDVRVEIDRYIAAPGQATAYKVGELKILELRQRAQSKLGPRYDIKNFHDQILMTGALPLAILEAKIDGWITAGGPAFAS